MTTYIYKAKKGPGEITSGEMDADSQESVVNRLVEMGLTPVSVVEKRISRLAVSGERLASQTEHRAPSAESRTPQTAIRVRTQEVDIFTRQLGSLIKAGIPVLRGMALIHEQNKHKAFGNIAADIGNRIRDGKMLSEAMAVYPNIFNNLYINLIKAGEKSGVLDEVLYKLAEYREKEEEIRRKIQSALAYPLLLAVVGIITVFVILTFFMPKIVVLFEHVEQLPLPTRLLMGISLFMQTQWHWLLMGLFFLTAVFFREKPGSKKKFFMDIIKLNAPLVKNFIMNSEIAKFARTLALLLKNGISIHEGLELSTNTLDNDALKAKLIYVRKEILNKGSTLSGGLKQINIFPPFAANMIAVGEESGRLEESLTEIANVYEREIEQSIKTMASLLEPILILVIGTIVGFIVFAMLLPIFNIGLMTR